MKYVGAEGGIAFQIFVNLFLAKKIIKLKKSWPKNFFESYSMDSPINFSFSFRAFARTNVKMLKVILKVILTVTFKHSRNCAIINSS